MATQDKFFVMHFFGDAPKNGPQLEHDRAHMTLMPEMRIKQAATWMLPRLTEAVRVAAEATAPFEVKLANRELYGTMTSAYSLADGSQAIALHNRMLEHKTVRPRDSRNYGKFYTPHVSMLADDQPKKLMVNNITLVQHVGKLFEDVRILDTFELTGEL